MGLLNRDFGNILSVFPRKNSKTQSSLNFLQSGPRKFTKSDFRDWPWDLPGHLQSPKPRNPKKSPKESPERSLGPPGTPEKVQKKSEKSKKLLILTIFWTFWTFLGTFGGSRGVPETSRETSLETFWGFGVLGSVDGRGDPKIGPDPAGSNH